MKLIDVKTPTNLEEEGGRGVGPLQKDGLDPPMEGGGQTVDNVVRVCFAVMSPAGDGSSDVALVYNDRAVLENYHVSAVFRLFRDDDYNILSGLKTDEYRSVNRTPFYHPRMRRGNVLSRVCPCVSVCL